MRPGGTCATARSRFEIKNCLMAQRIGGFLGGPWFALRFAESVTVDDLQNSQITGDGGGTSCNRIVATYYGPPTDAYVYMNDDIFTDVTISGPGTVIVGDKSGKPACPQTIVPPDQEDCLTATVVAGFLGDDSFTIRFGEDIVVDTSYSSGVVGNGGALKMDSCAAAALPTDAYLYFPGPITSNIIITGHGLTFRAKNNPALACVQVFNPPAFCVPPTFLTMVSGDSAGSIFFGENVTANTLGIASVTGDGVVACTSIVQGSAVSVNVYFAGPVFTTVDVAAGPPAIANADSDGRPNCPSSLAVTG